MSAVAERFLTCRLPSSETRGIWPLALFIAIQLADAAMTLTGVERFGLGAEGNPLLQTAAAALGVGGALLAYKSVAIFGAVVLHALDRHLALAILTVCYVAAALLPWTFVLAF